MTAEPEPRTERWVFGGSRIHNGRRTHEWIDAEGTRLAYKAKGSYAIGGIYEVRVVRQGDRITRYGVPVFTGDRTDQALADKLSAQHRAAEQALDLAARERAVKRDDAVELAITRLAKLAQQVPISQRTAFAVYVAMRVRGGR